MSPLHISLILLVVIYIALKLFSSSRSNAPSTYLRIVLLSLASALVLTPFVWLVCAAFKDRAVLMEYTFLPPFDIISSETINFGNFKKLIFTPNETPSGDVYFIQYVFNSIFLACTTTIVQLICCSMGGYALAKLNFQGKKLMMLFMLGTMMLPGMILLAPLYELVIKMGWVDTYWALIIPGSVNAFGMFLFRQAIVGIPDDLIEAGRLDGCSEFKIYWQLIMPLVRPMSGAFCLISFLASWNNFLGPQIFIQSNEKLPLPVIMSQYIGIYAQDYGIFLAGTLIAIIPPAILFFSLQKEFIAGLTSGAVKG